MKSSLFLACMLVVGMMAMQTSVNAQAPNIAFTTSGSCLNATSNFDSNLEPTKPNTAWTDTFAVVGSAIVSGNTSNVTEAGEYTISWPGTKATLSAGAFTATHTDTVTGPNSDGSFTVQIGTITQTFTAGPLTGLTATITTSGLTLKQWRGVGGTFVQGSNPPPVIETVTLSNGTTWKRICVRSVVVTLL
jgi:hypothetical protein